MLRTLSSVPNTDGADSINLLVVSISEWSERLIEVLKSPGEIEHGCGELVEHGLFVPQNIH